MTNIPFADVHRQYLTIKNEVMPEIEKVFHASAFTNGFSVKDFETTFAKYCQSKNAVACNNGTTALHLALCALNIKRDDEIIIPANTFIATAWAAAYVSAKPIFVDCSADTWEIDPTQIEKHITPKTKAIIGVHLYGQPFDFDAVKVIADKYSLPLVEDAAQAHGSTYKDKKIGSLGDLACFSFYPGKNLGTYGEGGAVTTNNVEYANRISMLRNHGSTVRYYHDEIGYNMRMGGVEAAVLNVKMKYIDGWNNNRKSIAKRYFSEIKNPKIKFQHQPDFADSVFHLFVITTENRENFMNHMSGLDISTALHYPVPCHLQKAFENLGFKKGSLPNAEYLAEHCVTLPMFPEMTNEEVQRVIDAVNKY
jgi:dTDP-4-amino-4,6-dideoxygalactose transaminase